MGKKKLIIVSHSHWDREWYQPFEEFRMRLVQMIDKLLDILDNDPDYAYFMMDGQTIVINDYLEIRPEKEEKIRRYMEEGRIQIGPWYILPDEFLISEESLIRNFLIGNKLSKEYGERMNIGYTPDSFGHISQLPQILKRLRIHSAAFMRGVEDAPNEYIWEAPDGSEVLVANLRTGYGNAVEMPKEKTLFAQRVKQIVNDLNPTATTEYFLGMNGSDHIEPMRELSEMIKGAQAQLDDIEIIHGTLDMFVDAIEKEAPKLERRKGEMRSAKNAPLLPGVLSTRMWLKQRNTECENLLTGWVEPAVAFAELLNITSELKNKQPFIEQAWKYLIQNHPHDSICGCSIDEVHDEMRLRYDKSKQIGEMLVSKALKDITTVIHTKNSSHNPAVVVFNPTQKVRDGIVKVQVSLEEEAKSIVFIGPKGERLYPIEITTQKEIPMQQEVSIDEMGMILGVAQAGEFLGVTIQGFEAVVEGTVMNLQCKVSSNKPANRDAIDTGLKKLLGVIEEGTVKQVRISVVGGTSATCTFLAKGIAPFGYKTYEVAEEDKQEHVLQNTDSCNSIENDFFKVAAEEDGTLTVIDKRTGTVYSGLNRFVDEGDRGDEYNFDEAENGVIIDKASFKPVIQVLENSEVRKTLKVSITYLVPGKLDETRESRSAKLIEMPVTSTISIVEESGRIDVETTVENRAEDHRLRVHFPSGIQSNHFTTENQFDVIHRPIAPIVKREGAVEQECPQKPQRRWCDVSDGKRGLMIANSGLPEVEGLQKENGVELALTLLRCVGWLSRTDLHCRRGHAGPGMPVPGGQCQGTHTFRYSIIPHTGDWKEAQYEALAFNLPLKAVVARSQEGTLPAVGSLLKISSVGIAASTIKKSEDGEALIVRLWNTLEEPCSFTVQTGLKLSSAAKCNLLEEETETLSIDDGKTISLKANQKEIVTVRLKFA